MFDNTLAALFNAYLKADPEKSVRLDEINHRIIRVRLREAEITRYVSIIDGQIEICAESESSHHDVAIDLSVKAVPALISGKKPLELVKQDMIGIEGDAHIVSVFQRVLREVEIDWEELLADRVGDTLAHQLSKLVRSGRQFGIRFGQTVKESVREYVFEEALILVSQQDLNDFYWQVDQLRESVDRIDARIARLEQQGQYHPAQ